MHRTAGDNTGAAARDAAATVAPLRRLYDAGLTATRMARHARAAELYARTVAAAEATLPAAGASLIVSGLLRDQFTAHIAAAGLHSEQGGASEERMAAVVQVAESRALLARACDIARARWRTGTLFDLSPEEEAFYPGSDVLQTGIIALLETEALVLYFHPASDDPDALCAVVLDALRAALEADARGLLELLPPLQQQQSQRAAVAAMTTEINGTSNVAVRMGLHKLLSYALSADGRLNKLRTLHGMSSVDEAALRALRQRVAASFDADTDLGSTHWAAMRQRATADVARHGLRACGLPECAQTEPHPKAFKVCGRCRAVVYCSAAHQQADWRRHKRDDGCKAAA
jgi:hypothetical protein